MMLKTTRLLKRDSSNGSERHTMGESWKSVQTACRLALSHTGCSREWEKKTFFLLVSHEITIFQFTLRDFLMFLRCYSRNLKIWESPELFSLTIESMCRDVAMNSYLCCHTSWYPVIYWVSRKFRRRFRHQRKHKKSISVMRNISYIFVCFLCEVSH